MKYSIAFFSETNFSPKTRIPRNHENMRTDLAWMCILEADCYNINFETVVKDKSVYDLIMVIVPKYNKQMQLLLLENIESLKKRCKKICWVQEGPSDLIHDFNIKEQFQYLELLKKFDALFCHNHESKQYFKFLSNGIPTYIINTTMVADLINTMHIPKKLNKEKSIKVIVSGNIGNWYHALDSYVIIKQLKKEYNIQPFCVSMGRKDPSEQFYTGYKYIPYTNWYNWMRLLNNMDIGINMTRRVGAESFNINCEFLGIPVVKRNSMTHYKYTTFFKMIYDNYDLDSKRAIDVYDYFYSEERFKENMNRCFYNILKES
ncbi:hypothetical protein K9M42_02590 [Patescibacteria group bacterium]|nr:hypothetical protein [Patescibacteria group bacterium]